MPATPQADGNGGVAERFEDSMVNTGTVPVVASELERRIEIIETQEMNDPSRLPFSGREIAAYVGVTVLAVLIGALVVAL
ncbi:hypothetical protein ACWPKO_30300 (plasmid) [Coraliomargarita sp. W4R53]